MNRRGALAMLGGSLLLARTVGAKAQAAKSVRHIGFLGPGSAPDPAFLQRVWAPTRDLGWIEGQNLIVERRYAEGKAERLKPYAEELVRLNVELILTTMKSRVRERERVYRSLGIQTIIVGARAASELENAVSEAARWRAQPLIAQAAAIGQPQNGKGAGHHDPPSLLLRADEVIE